MDTTASSSAASGGDAGTNPPARDVTVEIGIQYSSEGGFIDQNSSLTKGDSCTANPYTGQWQVVVTNQSDTVLGSGIVSEGQAGTVDDSAQCDVSVHIGQVPPESQYGVSVNGANPPIYFSASEAQTDDYQLGVTYREGS